MSRKDYVTITAVINKLVYTEYMDLPTLTIVAAGLADSFQVDNDRFDRQKFLAACFAVQP